MNKISQLNYNGTKVLAKYLVGVYNAIQKIPLGGIKRQNKEFVEILVIYTRVCLSDCETPNKGLFNERRHNPNGK